MDNVRKIVTEGKPYERGVIQGEQFGGLIRENIRNIKNSLETSQLNMEEYYEMTRRNAEFLRCGYPDQWEEMKGIAVGADVPFDDIVIINIPTYFMKNSFSQECSMLLARGGATSDGLTYLIKNRDMDMPVHQVVVEYQNPGGRSVIEVNGAGILTYPAIGINSDGLTVTSTGFWSPKTEIKMDDVARSHIFVNLHHLLERCCTVEDVLKMLDNYPRMNGLNIIAADRQKAAAIETTRDSYLCKWADEEGILFRTNHYCLGEHVGQNPERQSYLSTFMRYQRIEEMLSECHRKLRFQDLVRIMSDHKNAPVNGICRHPNSLSGTETVSCSIVVLEDGELFTTPGNPCENLILSKF